MKKMTKVLALTLTSFTLMTGCKGKEITAAEAKGVIDGISNAQDAAYDENVSWTVTTEIKGVVDGKDDKVKAIISYNAEESVIYTYSLSEGKETEYYYGFSADTYYIFDEVKGEYTSLGIGGSIAWEAQKIALFVASPETIGTAYIGLFATAANTEAEGYTYFSSGEGNLVVDVTEGESSASYTFKNNVFTGATENVKDDKNDFSSKTTVKYSSKYKLPNIKNYTKA